MALPGRPMPWILGGILIVLLAIVVASFLRRDADAELEPGVLERVPARDDPVATEDLSTSLAGERRDVVPAPTEAPSTVPHARGSLLIRVTDAATGSAVPGAECVVYSERGTEKTHATLRTDEHGRATVPDLPENTILVHVRRSPPFTDGFAGAFVRAGAATEVDVRLTAGGTVFGRVVDDAQSPIAGADVFLESDRATPTDWSSRPSAPVVRTDSDGRFEIPHVVSQPWSTWIVDGAMRPERWTDVSVRAQSGQLQAFARAAVEDGARVDLGDIALPRGGRFSGRVLDAQRAPVEGALVDFTRSWEMMRSRTKAVPVVTADMTLAAGTVLTRADGAFQVETGRPAPYATVTTRGGIFEQFTLAEEQRAGAGGLELVLSDWSILEIELVDELGAALTTSSPLVRDQDLRMGGGAARSLAGRIGQLDATLVLDGGREIHALFVADTDGLFRFRSSGTSAADRRLLFELIGYLPVDEHIGVQAGQVERRRFTLRPVPVVRVQLNIAAQPVATGPGPDLMALIHVCTLDSARFDALMRLPGSRCCGMGSMWTNKLQAGEHELAMPVFAAGSYWIHAYVPSSRRGPGGGWETIYPFEQHIGPVVAGQGQHEVNVPAIERLVVEDDPREPPPASDPGHVSLRARIVDSTTNKGIANATLWFTPVPNPRGPLGRKSVGVDREGVTKSVQLRPGLHSVSISARGYRVPAPREITVVEGETVDLGLIAIEPTTVVRLRVLESDGRPAPKGTGINMRGPDREASGLLQSRIQNDEGTAEIKADLGAGWMVVVDVPRDDADIDGMRGRQWIVHDFEPGATEQEIRLAPWHAIEVRVTGDVQEYPGAAVSVRSSLPEIDTSLGQMTWGNLFEVTPLADGTRRYRGEVGGPGPLRFTLRSALLQPASEVFQVASGNELQVFVIESAR